MAHILLGVTGSVAAVRTPALFGELTRRGQDVRIMATEPSLYFFDHKASPIREALYRDRDEWPGAAYRRDDPILHIELRSWADLLLLAPLDANTLAKFAQGLCDNLVTSVLRAWDFTRPIVLAPAMNTMMWENPVTLRHWRYLLEDHGDGRPVEGLTLDRLDAAFAERSKSLSVVLPQAKRLACGDVGLGAMAEVATLVEAVERVLSGLQPR
jgi:phosphopantothenoylcysteine decarboxylase